MHLHYIYIYMYICLYTYNSLHCMLECVWCTSTWKKRLKGNWPEAQMGYWGWLPRWFLFFVVFFPLVVLQIFSNNKKPFYHWKKKKEKKNEQKLLGRQQRAADLGLGRIKYTRCARWGPARSSLPKHKATNRRDDGAPDLAEPSARQSVTQSHGALTFLKWAANV